MNVLVLQTLPHLKKVQLYDIILPPELSLKSAEFRSAKLMSVASSSAQSCFSHFSTGLLFLPSSINPLHIIPTKASVKLNLRQYTFLHKFNSKCFKNTHTHTQKSKIKTENASKRRAKFKYFVKFCYLFINYLSTLDVLSGCVRYPKIYFSYSNNFYAQVIKFSESESHSVVSNSLWPHGSLLVSIEFSMPEYWSG